MPEVTVQLVADALNDREKPVKGSQILVLGVAYKPDIDDVRESPALDVLELLQLRGADVCYHDPYVEQLRLGNTTLASVPIDGGVEPYDCVVIVTNHAVFDYAAICRGAQLVIDTRNATSKIRADFADRIVTL